MSPAKSGGGPVTAAINSTTPSGVTVAVSGAGAAGRGANIVAAPLNSSPAGGRVLLLVMVTMLVRVGGHGWVPRRGCGHHSL
jgi:hypothetical protein